MIRLRSTSRCYGGLVRLLGAARCLPVRTAGFGGLVRHSRFTGDGG